MSAEEILLQQVWSMINEEHGEVLMSDNLQSRIESAFNVYAREYHAKEMERKLEEAEKKIENLPLGKDSRSYHGATWLLNHLKEPKTK